MASRGYITSYLNGLQDDIKKALTFALEYGFANLNLGGSPKANNFAWYAASGTTSTTANAEFSIAHGMDSPPNKFIPVMDLTAIGSQLVTLTVSRAPDARRAYFTSSSTGVTFSGYFE